MDLHRQFAARWGITAEQLESERTAPATDAYCDYLLRTASLGDFSELVAAVLPCMWSYAEIGRTLAAAGLPDHQGYAEWIEMYASDEFGQLAGWCRELTDAAATEVAGPGPAAHARGLPRLERARAGVLGRPPGGAPRRPRAVAPVRPPPPGATGRRRSAAAAVTRSTCSPQCSPIPAVPLGRRRPARVRRGVRAHARRRRVPHASTVSTCRSATRASISSSASRCSSTSSARSSSSPTSPACSGRAAASPGRRPARAVPLPLDRQLDAVRPAGLEAELFVPGIDALTLMARELTRGRACDRWWSRRSPFNALVDGVGRVAAPRPGPRRRPRGR